MAADEESIFAQAMALPSVSARSSFLDRACAGDAKLRAQVEALLASHDRSAGILDGAPPGLEAAADSSDIDEASGASHVGEMIGPYKLLEQIGVGGMGVVFAAEQTRPVRRMVALKIIKPGLDTKQVIARFEAERQALAMMDHPGIAKVLDAGETTAGRSYFVMELVRGIPITEYCDQNQLDPRRRLELFVQVCQAVQHAHTKGIIHRDLKPSNVLITLADDKALPKIIDFGVAKATAGGRLTDRTLFTELRQLIGTPLYMSPEQAEMRAVMDVDTRSDVYSLGVLLYELLTGTTPFDKHRLAAAAYDEVRRIIREEDPPRPSTRLSTLAQTLATGPLQRQTDAKKLGALVRGELDGIVMRALEKDRARRYETVNGFARDIERYLMDQPVEACPPSRAYRLKKFIRRNKAALATAGLIVCVLAAAAIISSWQAVRATRAEDLAARQRDEAVTERNRADEQAAIATAVNQFLGEMLTAADPSRMLGEKVTVLQATEEAIKKLDDGALKDRPLVEAAVRHTIGQTQKALSRLSQAEPHLLAALDLRRRHLPPNHPDIAKSVRELASLHYDRGEYPQGEQYSREAIELVRASLNPDMAALASAHRGLGWCIKHQRRRGDEAERAFEEAIDICRKHLPPQHAELAEALNGLAVLVHDANRLEEAEAAYRESLEIRRANYPPGHPRIARAISNLAMLLFTREQYPEAEKLQREARDIYVKTMPTGHREMANSAYHLARIQHFQHKYTEAEPLYLEALNIYRRVLPPGHNEIRHCVDVACGMFNDWGKFELAEQLAREQMEVQGGLRPPEDPEYRRALFRVADCLRAQGRYADLEHLYRDALAKLKDRVPPNHPAATELFQRLAGNLQLQGKFEQAKQLYREAIVARLRSTVKQSPPPWHELQSLGRLLHADGRDADAAQCYRDSVGGLRKLMAQDPQQPIWPNNIAYLLAICPQHSVRDPAEAMRLADRAIQLAPDQAMTLNTLGTVRFRNGDLAGALEALRRSAELNNAAKGFDHFVLAMAHQKLGDSGAAHEYYDNAMRGLREQAPELELSDILELFDLRREAEVVLELPRQFDVPLHPGYAVPQVLEISARLARVDPGNYEAAALRLVRATLFAQLRYKERAVDDFLAFHRAVVSYAGLPRTAPTTAPAERAIR